MKKEDKEAIIRRLDAMYGEAEGNETKEALFYAVEALKKQRPHGEWIKTGRTNIYGGFEIECSHCHNKLMVSPKRWEVGENFCDVCGSRNKKEGEAE